MNPDINSIQAWKIHHLANYVKSSKVEPSIIAITESWLKPHHSKAQVQLNNYNLFRADKLNNRERGGVLLYIKEDIYLLL